jgi:hypothetical protein
MSAAAPNPSPFAKFFRPKSGRPVARYGTATRSKGNDVIGGRWEDNPEARPDPVTGERPRRLVIDTSAIVALTHHEARRFRREYARAVRNGDLEEVTREQWEARAAELATPAGEADKTAADEADKQPPAASKRSTSKRKSTKE